MEIVYFTVAGIFLYFLSDWILEQIETMFGRRFEYRSLIFLVIIMVLSTSMFQFVQYMQRATAESPTENVITDEPGGGKAQDTGQQNNP